MLRCSFPESRPRSVHLPESSLREPLRWRTNAVRALLNASSGDMHLLCQIKESWLRRWFLPVQYNIKPVPLSTINCANWKKRENPQKDSGASAQSKKTGAKQRTARWRAKREKDLTFRRKGCKTGTIFCFNEERHDEHQALCSRRMDERL